MVEQYANEEERFTLGAISLDPVEAGGCWSGGRPKFTQGNLSCCVTLMRMTGAEIDFGFDGPASGSL